MINFKAALKALTDAEVNFVIVGAFAAGIHGSVHVTRDLDICYERTPENLKRLVAALISYHPRLRGAPEGIPFIFDERTLAGGMNFTFQTDLGDIDLLGELSGLGSFPEIMRDAVTVQVYDITCRIASLDALIRSKRAAARPKDFNVLPELEALRDMQVEHKKNKGE